jgi:hypothetical protein
MACQETKTRGQFEYLAGKIMIFIFFINDKILRACEEKNTWEYAKILGGNERKYLNLDEKRRLSG